MDAQQVIGFAILVLGSWMLGRTFIRWRQGEGVSAAMWGEVILGIAFVGNGLNRAAGAGYYEWVDLLTIGLGILGVMWVRMYRPKTNKL